MHSLMIAVFLLIGIASITIPPLGGTDNDYTYLPPTEVTAPFQPTAPLPTFTYEWTKQ
jgi:hypothetical protein